MKQEEFFVKLKQLLPGATPEVSTHWASWADEWAGLNRDYFEEGEDETSCGDNRFLLCIYKLRTGEAVMETLYAKFKQVHDLYGAEIAMKLYLQGVKDCLYAYEFLGAAQFLHEGGSESDLSRLSIENGLFDDDDPDFWNEV